MQTLKSTGCVLDWRGGTCDWSRYHHSITEHNTIPVRGVNGEARYFNGVDAHINCGNDSSLNIRGAITIETWIKLDDWTTGADAYAFAYKNAFRFYIWNNKIFFYIFEDGTVGVISAEVDCTNYETSKWYHIAGVFDATTGIGILYVNGIEVASDSDTGVTAIEDSSGDIFYIGKYGSDYLDGTISSVKIHNRALTPLEIWNNYQVMKPYIPLSESPVAIV